jgi:CheY-like chemotaxis protein
MASLLIVDNDPTVSATLKQVFEERCADVVTIVGDAAAALQLVAQSQPDAVFMACGVSEVDALDLAAQLRARYATPLVLYGLLKPQDDDRFAPLADTVMYLASPISVDELLVVRNRAVERTV